MEEPRSAGSNSCKSSPASSTMGATSFGTTAKSLPFADADAAQRTWFTVCVRCTQCGPCSVLVAKTRLELPQLVFAQMQRACGRLLPFARST